MKLLYWQAIGLCVVLAACNGYSAKDTAPRKGGQAAKDCSEDRAPGASSDEGSDPWGDSYGLVQETVSYEEIKPMLTQWCVSCHAGYDSYDTAKAKIDTYIARMDLGEDETGFMPKGGSKISLEDRSRLIGWKYAGFPQAGDPPPSSDSDRDDSLDRDDDDDDGWTRDTDAEDDC